MFDIRANWELFGIQLGIDDDTIAAIKLENAGSPTWCLRGLLSTWLKENYDTQQHGYPSWRRLCVAIASPAGAGNQSLADTIAERHKISLKQGFTKSKINYFTLFNMTLIYRHCLYSSAGIPEHIIYLF